MAGDPVPNGGMAPGLIAGGGLHPAPAVYGTAENGSHNTRLRRISLAIPPRNRIAVILSSGALIDAPIGALAAVYERMQLVNIVHPRAARCAAALLDNAVLRTEDISGGDHPASSRLAGAVRLPRSSSHGYRTKLRRTRRLLPGNVELVIRRGVAAWLRSLVLGYRFAQRGSGSAGPPAPSIISGPEERACVKIKQID